MDLDEEELRPARADNKAAQVVYHDHEADGYDAKWSISFDRRCTDYARDRFVAVVGADDAAHWPYRSALEIGAGTAFFSLNLKLAGVLEAVTVTDLSPGMVAAAQRNAAELGVSIQADVVDAESLSYPDDTFDLVVGHAVLHHIPDVEQALRQVVRVLKPGGRLVMAGEPTTIGDWYARGLGRLTWAATTQVTRLPRLRQRFGRSEQELTHSSRAHALESIVDLHTFDPDQLARIALRAGAVDVRTSTEELTAAWLGWPVRTIEAAVRPGSLGSEWALFAYRAWSRLSALDRGLARVVPPRFFYNASVTGIKPG
ncbi:MAG TPA: class I SAM-dependent methyltransferase [Dermatophilaceae bacterium]|nr:class I SAM-dependent methyltransferase [Dermatophilaceae bacterium]